MQGGGKYYDVVSIPICFIFGRFDAITQLQYLGRVIECGGVLGLDES